MTWSEIISKTTTYLDSKSVSYPLVAAECLAARLLKCARGTLHQFLQKEIDQPRIEAMRRAVKRLTVGEPLQYVLGEWDFRRLTLKCDKRALIPRPETEELVTRVLSYLKRSQLQKPFVVDVGTGTGAIILSIASEFNREGIFLGTDFSDEALSLAKENADNLSLSDRVSFVKMDGLDDFDEPMTIDALVSNPPYIATAECERLDSCVKDFEPRLALDGGVDGLDFYRRYLADALNLLKPGGGVFFEIGNDQGEALRSMMENFGFSEIKIEKDYSGHDRYASAILS
jgi:release factor glutamine methyltransferase